MMKGLLGFDPYEQQQAQAKLWAGLYGSAASPYEKMGLALGQLGGSLLGGESPQQAQAQTLNKVLAEVNAQYTPDTPEYFKAIAAALPNDMSNSKAYALQEARRLEQAASENLMKETKFINENPTVATDRLQELAARIEANPNDKTALKQYNVLSNAYQQGFYENQKKMQEAPGTAADRAVYEDLVRKNNGDIVSAGRQFNQYKTDLKQKENTPLTVGEIKPSDVNTLLTNVNTQLKPLDTKLRAYNEIRALIQQVNSGNTAAVPQLERFLAKAAGDNQISATEVKQLANTGGFVERTVGGVQKFVLGTPTTTKLNDTINLINSLENQTSKEYNSTRDKLEATWSTSAFPKQTLDAALGSRYIPVSQRDKFKAPQELAPTLNLPKNDLDLVNKYLKPKG